MINLGKHIILLTLFLATALSAQGVIILPGGQGRCLLRASSMAAALRESQFNHRPIIVRYAFEYKARESENFQMGVEVEGSISSKRHQSHDQFLRDLTPRAKKDLSSIGGLSFHPLTSSWHLSLNGQGMVRLDLKSDSSILTDGLPTEAVSTILKSQKELEGYAELVRALDRGGLDTSVESAALQFHVGLRPVEFVVSSHGGKIAELKMEAAEKAKEDLAVTATVFAIYSVLDPLIRDRIRISPERARFVQPIEVSLLTKMATGQVRMSDFEAYQKNNAEKPALLFTRFNTFEFRIANSTSNPQSIVAQGLFWHRMVDAILRKDPVFMDYFLKRGPEEVVLEEVMELLKIEPNQFLGQ